MTNKIFGFTGENVGTMLTLSGDPNTVGLEIYGMHGNNVGTMVDQRDPPIVQWTADELTQLQSLLRTMNGKTVEQKVDAVRKSASFGEHLTNAANFSTVVANVVLKGAEAYAKLKGIVWPDAS